MANELSRTNTVKKKLETLCKELQKQNKTVLDQSKQVSAEEQEKRKELSDRFSETIKDVQDKIASHDEERQKQDQENTKLREQLQSFLNQYEVRDKHFEHQLHAKDLEVQLAEARLEAMEWRAFAIKARNACNTSDRRLRDAELELEELQPEGDAACWGRCSR